MAGVLAVSLALSACGGSSSTVSAQAYVKSLCQAIGPFEKSFQATNAALNQNLTTIKSLTGAKAALQAFLDSTVSETNKVVSQLKAAGTPDVSNGKQISNGINGVFTQLQTALSQAQNSAKSVPTNSPQAFKASADNIEGQIRTSMSGVGSGLSGLNSPQLDAAAKKEPACTSLNGG